MKIGPATEHPVDDPRDDLHAPPVEAPGLLVVGVHPAREVTEVDEQAQAGQPLGKVAGLPDVASWCRHADRDEVSAADGGRRPVAPHCVDTVRTWRGRFRREGMPDLFDRPRSGRPPVYGIEDQLLIVDPVTQQTPHFISRNRPNSKS
jgi:hypothetical protein